MIDLRNRTDAPIIFRDKHRAGQGSSFRGAQLLLLATALTVGTLFPLRGEPDLSPQTSDVTLLLKTIEREAPGAIERATDGKLIRLMLPIAHATDNNLLL